MAKPRFQLFDDEELQAFQKDLEVKNTIKNEKKVTKCFQEFLEASGEENLDFWTYEDQKLDALLGKFYFGARTREGELYSLGTMNTFRYALQRVLSKKDRDVNILKRSETNKTFHDSIRKFDDVKVMLKREHKAVVKPTPEITPTGTF